VSQSPLRRLLQAIGTAIALLGCALVSTWTWGDAAAELVPLVGLRDGVKTVVLGNSIALSNIDADLLAAALERPPSTVSQLAERGSQPAHWLAKARHRVFLEGHRPDQVVVVSPLELLVRERLSSPRDTARLLALLTRPDPPLWDVAVGSDGVLAFAGRQREVVRYVSMSALTEWLPAVLGMTEDLAAARAQQSPIPRDPTARPLWIIDPGAPSAGRAERDPARREPESSTVDEWALLPALAGDVREAGGQLWVVVPPLDPRERRSVCGRNAQQQAVADALDALEVKVLDLTDAPLDSSWFVTRHHLEGDGVAWMSEAVGQALKAQQPGRPGCE